MCRGSGSASGSAVKRSVLCRREGTGLVAANGDAERQVGAAGRDGPLGTPEDPGNDPSRWFENVYAAAGLGTGIVPWDRGAPHWLLVDWARDRALDGKGRRALVVGCGLGDDAEYIQSHGFASVAFDISPTAIALARRRFPGSTVDYHIADLLAPPEAWREAFDLVVEVQTIQALPAALRHAAIARIGRMVAPGGSLVVVCLARDADDDPGGRPPWPITRAEIDAFGQEGLLTVRVDDVTGGPDGRAGRRWRAEFRRPVPEP